jgi:hypothetical protein
MRFAWDKNKSRTNLAKHGIAFATAAKVFDDHRALSFPERSVEGEQRWKTIGWAEVSPSDSVGCAHGIRRRSGRNHPHYFGPEGNSGRAERL